MLSEDGGGREQKRPQGVCPARAGERSASHCHGRHEAESVVDLADRASGRTMGSPSSGKTGALAFQVSWIPAEARARPGAGSSPLFREAA